MDRSSAQEFEVTTRAQALASGSATYFTGKPCKRGGIAMRISSNGNCTCSDCREVINATSVRSHKKNPETTKERHQRYRENNKENLTVRMREYYEKNHKKIVEYKKAWHDKNRIAIADKKRTYRALNKAEISIAKHNYYQKNRTFVGQRSRDYYEKNRGSIAERARQYYQDNRHVYYALGAKRRAAQRERLPQWFGEFDQFVMQEAADLCRVRQESTGLKWHVDHMVPMQSRKASGLHCGHNLQVIPGYLNLRKNNKLWLHEPDQWLHALRAVA